MLANCNYHNDNSRLFRQFPQHPAPHRQYDPPFAVTDGGSGGVWYGRSARVDAKPSTMFPLPPIGTGYYPSSSSPYSPSSSGMIMKTIVGRDQKGYDCGAAGYRKEMPTGRYVYNDCRRFTVPPRAEPFTGMAVASSSSSERRRSFSPTSTASNDDWPFDDVNGNGSVAIARRNERERNRVRTINQTFNRLRQHLPASMTWAAAATAAAAAAAAATNGSSSAALRQKVNSGDAARRSLGRYSAESMAAIPRVKSKKLSKVQILRAAIEYIAHLQRTLSATDVDADEADDDNDCSEDERSFDGCKRQMQVKNDESHTENPKPIQRLSEVDCINEAPSYRTSGDIYCPATATASLSFGSSTAVSDLVHSPHRLSRADRITCGQLSGKVLQADADLHFRSALFQSRAATTSPPTEGKSNLAFCSANDVKFELSNDCSDVTCNYDIEFDVNYM